MLYSYLPAYLYAVPAPTTYPLDDVPGATGAWSTRLLSIAYAGQCLRVQRSSDSTEQDIGFVGPLLDTAALMTFVGAGNGIVVTWYDQSGNGRNLTQASAGPRPTIVTGGALMNEINGQPCLGFGDTQYLDTAAAVSTFLTTSAGTVACIARATTITDANSNLYNNHALWAEVTGGNCGSHCTFVNAITEVASYNFDTNVDGAFATIVASTPFAHMWCHRSGNVENYLNSGTPTTTASGNTGSMAGVLRVGSSYNTNFGLIGQVADILTYSTALSSGDIALLGAAIVAPYGLAWS